MAGRIIGGIIATVGALISLVALLPTVMMSWRLWEGNPPDIIQVSGGDGWSFTAWQFLGVCGMVLLVGLALVGIGVQFFFRSTHPD
jgi:hypothetical protein